MHAHHYPHRYSFICRAANHYDFLYANPHTCQNHTRWTRPAGGACTNPITCFSLLKYSDRDIHCVYMD